MIHRKHTISLFRHLVAAKNFSPLQNMNAGPGCVSKKAQKKQHYQPFVWHITAQWVLAVFVWVCFMQVMF